MTALPPGWEAVLGEHASPARRHPSDASAWRLVTAAGRTILFDAGAGIGPSPAAPDLLILTHGHADHAGGAARLRARGSNVLSGALTADWLARADEAAVSLDRARTAGIYPAEYRLPACAVDRVLSPGEGLAVDDVAIEAVAAAGHSADHLAWLVTRAGRRSLVAGDALLAGGTVILQDTWDCSVPETCATIRRLAALGPDDVLPGHGPAMVGDAARAALAAAMGRVSRLLPPALFL